jgi:hypothetical protein
MRATVKNNVMRKKRSVCLNILCLALTLTCLLHTQRVLALDAAVTLINTQSQETLLVTNEMMDALPQESFNTSTIWNEGINTYSGPSLRSVLDLIATSDHIKVIRLTAANDYVIDIPVHMIGQHQPILTTRINDTALSLRQKGPVWLMFPFDSDPSYQSARHKARAVWQLIRIDVTLK